MPFDPDKHPIPQHWFNEFLKQQRFERELREGLAQAEDETERELMAEIRGAQQAIADNNRYAETGQRSRLTAETNLQWTKHITVCREKLRLHREAKASRAEAAE